MSQESLENFGAYRLAMELFDLVVEDMGQVERHPQTYRLVGQQVASADSICSNIEEGHGRETTKDYTHFLVMARGSAQRNSRSVSAHETLAARRHHCRSRQGVRRDSRHTQQDHRVAETKGRGHWDAGSGNCSPAPHLSGLTPFLPRPSSFKPHPFLRCLTG